MLKNFTVPFDSPAAPVVLLAAAATASTVAGRFGIVSSGLPSAEFQTRNDLSSEPEITLIPSLVSAIDLTLPVCPARVRRTFPLLTSNTLIDLSADPVKS